MIHRDCETLDPHALEIHFPGDDTTAEQRSPLASEPMHEEGGSCDDDKKDADDYEHEHPYLRQAVGSCYRYLRPDPDVVIWVWVIDLGDGITMRYGA